MERKTVLITGATAGIGYELAKLFAENDFNLVLVARNKERLRKVAQTLKRVDSGNIAIIPKDLVEPKAADDIARLLDKKGMAIDILVNNAGFGARGAFSATSLQDEIGMIQVNIAALTHLTKLLLPVLIKRKGKILNVASTAAFQPGPYMAVYCATKAYVLSFSEALAKELEGQVAVTTLCPGYTTTEFHERANAKTLPSGMQVMTAADVARIGFNALMKGERLVITGFRNKFFTVLVRFLPRKMVLDFAAGKFRE